MGSLPSSTTEPNWTVSLQAPKAHHAHRHGASENVTLLVIAWPGPQRHANPLLVFKLKYISIKAFWGRVLFFQEWVCLLSFSLFETISFVPPFSFLNVNGPESRILPEFEYSDKKQSKIFLSRKPAGWGPSSRPFSRTHSASAGRLWGHQGLMLDVGTLRFLFCLSPHRDSG